MQINAKIDGMDTSIGTEKSKNIQGDTYKKRSEIEKYSHVATFDEIKENDFNLNIPRYVDTFEEEEPVDIKEVQKNIASIESELAQVQKEMAGYLKELGL